MNPAPVTILLVEDSPSDAVLLQESLRDAGVGHFDFTNAASLQEAVGHLGRGRFEVVLLDLTLPDSTGQQTYGRIRAAAPHLPIVVMTGVADEAVALEAVRQGVQDYLVKGQVDGRLTARAIRYAIERKRAEEALKQAEAALRERERLLCEWNLELEQRVVARTAELEETNADLEDFSHSITHDLRAPLRAMSAFAQLLREECTACVNSSAQAHIQRIITAASRMDKLIQDVLQYSRTARSQLKLAPVDVAALLGGIIESYPALQPPQVEIRIEEPLPFVLGNEAALTQCFANLLSNAVKFVPAGTRPEVRIWAEAATPPAGPRPSPGAATQALDRAVVRLWFADNGVGIPRDAQQQLFKLFQRLNKTYDGMGVGLSVVRRAVEKMGGRVGVESEPGRGSRFWLELTEARP